MLRWVTSKACTRLPATAHNSIPKHQSLRLQTKTSKILKAHNEHNEVTLIFGCCAHRNFGDQSLNFLPNPDVIIKTETAGMLLDASNSLDRETPQLSQLRSSSRSYKRVYTTFFMPLTAPQNSHKSFSKSVHNHKKQGTQKHRTPCALHSLDC